MAGTVTRTAAAVRKEAAPPAEEDSSIVTASFGKFGEQSVPKTSPIGIITAAVQAVAGRLKDDSLPQDLSVFPDEWSYSLLKQCEGKRIVRMRFKQGPVAKDHFFWIQV